MTEPTMREVLAELAVLRAKVERRSRRQRTRRIGAISVVALLVALVPLSLLASTPFNDLNFASPHNGNIDAIYNAGITRGCVPNQQYCPNGLVTREEMASFLARTAGIGGNPPVTNAATVNGYPANMLVRTTGAGTGNDFLPLTTSYQTLIAVTITVPTTGFVMVSGGAEIYAAGSSASGSIVSARLRDVSTAVASYPLLAAVGTSTGYTYEASLTPVTIFPVSGSGARTFTLDVGRNSTAFGLTTATHGTITALFVPFGPGGAQGAELPLAVTQLGPPEEGHRP